MDIKTKRPDAPASVAYLISVCVAVGSLVAIICIICRNWNVFFCVSCGLIIVCLVLKTVFNWEVRPCVKWQGHTLIYEYEEPISALGHNKIRYEIDKGCKVSSSAKTVVFKGGISCKEPLRKKYEVKKLKIKNLSEDEKKFILSGFDV